MPTLLPNSSCKTPSSPHGRKLVKSLVIALSVSAFILPAPAYAFDFKAVLQAMKSDVEAKGGTMSFGTVEANGVDNGRVRDLVIIDGRNSGELRFEELAVSGIITQSENDYAFDSLNATGIKILARQSNETEISIAEFSARDVDLPPFNEKTEAGKDIFWPFTIASSEIKGFSLANSEGQQSLAYTSPSISLKELNIRGDANFSLGALSVAGGNGSIRNPSGENGSYEVGALSLARLDFKDQTSFGLGSFLMEPIYYAGTDKAERPIDIKIGTIDINEVHALNVDGDGRFPFPSEDMRFSMDGFSMDIEQKPAVVMGALTSNAKYDEEVEELLFDTKLASLFADLDNIPPTKDNRIALKQLRELGYNDIDLAVELKGSWDMLSGEMNIPLYRIALANMGAFSMGMSLDGYTMDFVKRLQAITKRIGLTKDPEIVRAMNIQMMALFSELALKDMSLSVEDDSLTQRVIKQQAEKTGQSSQDLMAALPFLTGAALAPLQAPEFASQISAAISTFVSTSVDDSDATSGKITVTASPDAAITVPEMIGLSAAVRAGNIQADEVIERLNIRITGE